MRVTALLVLLFIGYAWSQSCECLAKRESALLNVPGAARPFRYWRTASDPALGQPSNRILIGAIIVHGSTVLLLFLSSNPLFVLHRYRQGCRRLFLLRRSLCIALFLNHFLFLCRVCLFFVFFIFLITLYCAGSSWPRRVTPRFGARRCPPVSDQC